MSELAQTAAPGRALLFAGRSGPVLAALAAVLLVAVFAGVNSGALLLIGLGLGVTLEGLGFGFAGPWRRMILHRDAGGLVAQLVSIALVAMVAMPWLSSAGAELRGAHAPVGLAMVGGAFVFGASMQIVLGCGSGTLVNAGSGNAASALALPFFALGSFAGAYHLTWWTGLGTAPLVVLSGTGGLAATLVGLAAVGLAALALSAPGGRRISPRLWFAAALVAGLAIVHLAVAGQPWGVVYGLGLWVAKGATSLGADLTGSPFWASPANAVRVEQSLLTDVTSLTNLGLIGGAMLVTSWRRVSGRSASPLPGRAWVAAAVAGLLLGYSSRLAFGCNVGAFFSGVSTGSLHGWAWFAAAFVGSVYGIRLRPVLGLEARS